MNDNREAGFDVETLGAYLDGVLSAEAANALEQAVSDDLRTRRALAEIALTDALVRTAFAGDAQAPVPARLIATIDQGFAARAGDARGRPGNRRRTWIAGVAAVAAALVLSVGLSTWLAERHVEQTLARIEADHATDRMLRAQAVSSALETALSGTPVEWHNPDSGGSGTVTPVRTFRSTDSRWCREYQSVTTAGAQTERKRAIACRQDNGIWATRVEMPIDS